MRSLLVCLFLIFLLVSVSAQPLFLASDDFFSEFFEFLFGFFRQGNSESKVLGAGSAVVSTYGYQGDNSGYSTVVRSEGLEVIATPSQTAIKKDFGKSSSACDFREFNESACDSTWSVYKLTIRDCPSNWQAVFDFVDCTAGRVLNSGVLCNGESSDWLERPAGHSVKFAWHYHSCPFSCNNNPVCSSGWLCKDSMREVFQESDCYWVNENYCSNGCSDSTGRCSSQVTCSSDSDCGVDGWVGSVFCSNNDVYQDWKAFTCNNPGSSSSYCSNSVSSMLKEDCGESGWSGSAYCYGGDVFRDWIERGCSGSSCFANSERRLVQDCSSSQTCSSGSCVGSCISHSYYSCFDDDVYWFDSCSNREDKKQECGSFGCSGNSCNSISVGDYDYCTSSNPCKAGEGDCDSDNECVAGLKCEWDSGTDYSFFDFIDVCKIPDYGCHFGSPGSLNFCTSSWQRNCPCGPGEGDCDSDLECKQSLKCIQDVGSQFSYSSSVDVCLPQENVTFVPAEVFSSPEPDQLQSSTESKFAVNIEGFGQGSLTPIIRDLGNYIVTITSHTDSHFNSAWCLSEWQRNQPIPHSSVMIYRKTTVGGKQLVFDLHVGKIIEGRQACYVAFESVSKAVCQKFCDKTPKDIFFNPPVPYPYHIPQDMLDNARSEFHWETPQVSIPQIIVQVLLGVFYVASIGFSIFTAPSSVVSVYVFGYTGAVAFSPAVSLQASAGLVYSGLVAIFA